eukprot:maker-scaffold_54-snap-gene-1.24-mRNA-1 protein AED:0.37 eAED:0.41 QI:0/0/0/0.5/1/1/2/0/516
MNTKEKKAKVLTIIRKYLDISLHYLIHGIREPSEVINIIEKYCIGNKTERILRLEDSLSNPEGRYFLEKIKSFNVSYRDMMMLGGTFSDEKAIHKLFSIAPNNLAVSLLQKEIQVYANVIPEKQHEEFIKKSNVHRERSALLCYKYNQKVHFKINCHNPWYCTICKKQGHSSYRCIHNDRNKKENDNKKHNNTFVNTFIGMLKADFNIYNMKTQENKKSLIIDSGDSYHCCGIRHIQFLKNIVNLETPKLVGAAGGKIYTSMKKGVFEAILDNDTKIKLYDVYIFEDLQVFLVPMAALMSKGISIMTEKDTKENNNLFKIKYKTNENKNNRHLNIYIYTETLVGITKSNTSKVEFLHNKFGHQGIEAFKLTLNYYGYEVNQEELKNFVCKVCEDNNVKKSIIKRKDAVGFKGQDGEFFVLDSVDVLKSSRAGNSGFILATDICSKYRFIFCYKKKSDITTEIIKFFRWFQVATDIEIKRIHSDQGREIYNIEIINYYEEHGIYFSVSTSGYLNTMD